MRAASLNIESSAQEVNYPKFKFKDENVPPSYIVFESQQESRQFIDKIKMLSANVWPENAKHFITYQATPPKPVSANLRPRVISFPYLQNEKELFIEKL